MLHRKIQGNEGNLSTETDMAKTGRPPLEPRIAALEARMAEIESNIRELAGTIVMKPIEPVIQRHVEGSAYTPLFDRWPGNGS